jgi:hypothetical protein
MKQTRSAMRTMARPSLLISVLCVPWDVMMDS